MCYIQYHQFKKITFPNSCVEGSLRFPVRNEDFLNARS